MSGEQQENINRMQDESSEQMVNENGNSSMSSSPEYPKKLKPRSPNVCSNKYCASFKNTKFNQNNENNVENLCSSCMKQYQKQLYCLYCKQVYFQTTDDGKEWIMCDQCERWVHTQCADILTNGLNSGFHCLKCRKIQIAPTTSAPTRRPNANRISGPGKVPERRKTQECMLNNFGFFWQLSPAELAQDVQKLKQFMR